MKIDLIYIKRQQEIKKILKFKFVKLNRKNLQTFLIVLILFKSFIKLCKIRNTKDKVIRMATPVAAGIFCSEGFLCMNFLALTNFSTELALQ